jgi:hypothetical protein
MEILFQTKQNVPAFSQIQWDGCDWNYKMHGNYIQMESEAGFWAGLARVPLFPSLLTEVS